MFITYILIRPHLLNDNNPIWTRSYHLHDDINVLSSDNRTIYILYLYFIINKIFIDNTWYLKI